MVKKFFLSLFSLGLLVPAAMSSSAKLANSKEVLAVSKETTRSSEKLTTYIPTYVQGNFTFKTAGSEEVVDGSTHASFKVDPITTTFWGDRHFNAPDYFYRGIDGAGVGTEGWTGTITTKEWVQKKRYVTVLLRVVRLLITITSTFTPKKQAKNSKVSVSQTQILAIHMLPVTLLKK